MSINDLFQYLAIMRYDYNRRPWASHTKKGPGRKHQQGQPMTKQERNGG
jgi:hypothetical protein